MSWAELRQTGTLPVGIEVADAQGNPVLHRSFELRPSTVGDNIKAAEKVGSHNGYALMVAMLSFQLVALGTLKPKQIHYDLLCRLNPADYNALEEAQTALQKKVLEQQSVPASGSASGQSSSSDVGSAGQTPDS